MARRRCTVTLTLAWLAATSVTPATSWAGQEETVESLKRRATTLAYSHDHDEAVALLRRAVALAPDDSSTHRNLASVMWLQILFKRGAVTVDHYLGSFSKSRVDLPKPPPALDTEFRQEVQRAIQLAEARLAAHPRDPQAHYDLGAAVGLQASYIASVEGKLLAGFKAARRAYDAHEKVMELDPGRKDAGLIVGTYRYIVSTLSLPIRLMAYVAGFGGGRERGIGMLEETAAAGGDAGTDALFALVLVYNREKRYDDALRSLEELRRRYPRNRLVLLEAGSTALRAGRVDQAEKVLSEGLRMLPADESRRMPGEEALWRYKRGTALAQLKREEASLADLRVATSPSAQAWVHGRARVEIARLAMVRGDRGAAALEAREARVLCEKGRDPVCVEDAKKLLRAADGR
jgi:tetratricopeptide (TPR) repeat protein